MIIVFVVHTVLSDVVIIYTNVNSNAFFYPKGCKVGDIVDGSKVYEYKDLLRKFMLKKVTNASQASRQEDN